MAKSKRKAFSKQNRLLVALLLVAALASALYLYTQGEFPQTIAPATSPTSTSPTAQPSPASSVNGQYLDAYVLDVGQGDSIFLCSPSGKTMLIDASESHMYDRIDTFLKAQGVTKLDVVIATHPHADHIGGMREIVLNYEIGAFYMPDADATTKTYENLLDALDERDVPVYEAVAGEYAFIEWDEAVEVRILSPFAGEAYKDMNDWSIMCRVRLGDTAMLLTGDAETHAEQIALRELPASYFQAGVLKVGHHGSSSSTSQAFLHAVQPEIAIMSLGEDNTYGHPHKETVETLQQAGVKVYRTDLNGTVHIRMDGKTYDVNAER